MDSRSARVGIEIDSLKSSNVEDKEDGRPRDNLSCCSNRMKSRIIRKLTTISMPQSVRSRNGRAVDRSHWKIFKARAAFICIRRHLSRTMNESQREQSASVEECYTIRKEGSKASQDFPLMRHCTGIRQNSKPAS